MPATYTPIRYPGGKTKLYPLVKKIIGSNDLFGCTYAEAFAGGAGLAMKLLLKGDVSRILLNDLDRAVYCMWKVIVEQPEEMCEFIDSCGPTIDEWHIQREFYRNQDSVSDSCLGKAAFFLNRTNVSGIIKGGVIGGLEQQGNYLIDARFGKADLKRKIRSIAKYRDAITLTNLDAEDFIDQLQEDGVFAYFDPPYVKKGPGLYENSFDETKHRSLAEKIATCPCSWIVTYDANQLVEDIYSSFVMDEFDIQYSAHSACIGREKLIVGPGLKINFLKKEAERQSGKISPI